MKDVILLARIQLQDGFAQWQEKAEQIAKLFVAI